MRFIQLIKEKCFNKSSPSIKRPVNNAWDAKAYSQFLDLRTRPAIDLLSVFPITFQPKIIYDLGCGPGNSTILLKNRWPTANVIGIDSSVNMLEEARATYPKMDFIEGDIANFSVDEKIDLICANASLQWVDNHEILLPHLISLLNRGGAIAIQMPNNFHAPTHQVTIELLNRNSEWQLFLNKLRYGKLTRPFYYLPDYYDLLTDAGLVDLHLWATEYFQEMPNHEAIFDWVKATGLRPVLSSMQEDVQAEFTQAYIEEIAKAYPRQKNGKILLPFQRIFMVGYTPKLSHKY